MSRSASILCGVVVASLASGLNGFCQQPDKPGKEHELLMDFVGSWDVVVKFGDEQSKGTAVYKMECGGLWLTCEFTGDFGDVQFQGRGLDGYDPEKKKYIGIWVDSMTASPMISEGTYDESAKKLTYLSQGKGLDGRPAKIRSVTTLTSKARHDFEMFTIGADGKDQLMMRIEYTRKK